MSDVPELRRLVPDFEVIVDDLVTQPDEALKRRPLGTLPQLVLWVLRDGRTMARLLERVTAWAEELAQLVHEAPEDTVTVVRYILSVAGDEPSSTSVRHSCTSCRQRRQ